MTNQEIDALVAQHVMGWHRQQDNVWPNLLWWADEDSIRLYHAEGDAWRPSTDIAHAWQVVERMLALGWVVDVNSPDDRNPSWCCDIGHYMREGGYAEAASAPLAICLAALEELGVEHD